MIPFQALVRDLCQSLLCTICGEPLSDCEIEILATQGEQASVSITCLECATVSLLNIVIQNDEVKESEIAPISSDELLDLHLALKGLQSGFSTLFQKK